MRRGDASTTYNVVAYCGPTHVKPENAFLIIGGGFSTNASAAGSGIWVVSAATPTAQCGAGSQAGHIDRLGRFDPGSTAELQLVNARLLRLALLPLVG